MNGASGDENGTSFGDTRLVGDVGPHEGGVEVPEEGGLFWVWIEV